LNWGVNQKYLSHATLVFFEMSDFFEGYLPLKLTFVADAEIEECA